MPRPFSLAYISQISFGWLVFYVCQVLIDGSDVNTLRPRQHGRHFPDDIFRCIFLNENIWIAINISLSFVPKGPIDNIPALVQIMAWRRSGHRPLSEPMIVSLLTHICVTRPQWVNDNNVIGLLWHFKCKHLTWNHNAMFIGLANNAHQYGMACFANPKQCHTFY